MKIIELKLINGIKYFLKNTNNAGITKLFKLLYFWDFSHFKKYGTSVTGLTYFTYSFGPVPEKLYNQILSDNLTEEISKNFKIIKEVDKEDEKNYPQYKFYLKNKNIDLNWLTPNEQEIMKEIAFVFKNSSAKEMSDITHLKGTPYDKTKSEKGMNAEIDYFLSIDSETELDLDTIRERFSLQKELIEDGRL